MLSKDLKEIVVVRFAKTSQGAGQQLNAKRAVHQTLKLLRSVLGQTVDVPQSAQDGYLRTIRHLVDTKHGHFCEQRHPDVGNGKVRLGGLWQ